VACKPKVPATSEKVFDESGERLERVDLRGVDRPLSDEIDTGTRQEHRYLQAGGDASVGDRERNRLSW
jgi:hypothetical protein